MIGLSVILGIWLELGTAPSHGHIFNSIMTHQGQPFGSPMCITVYCGFIYTRLIPASQP